MSDEKHEKKPIIEVGSRQKVYYAPNKKKEGFVTWDTSQRELTDILFAYLKGFVEEHGASSEDQNNLTSWQQEARIIADYKSLEGKSLDKFYKQALKWVSKLKSRHVTTGELSSLKQTLLNFLEDACQYREKELELAGNKENENRRLNDELKESLKTLKSANPQRTESLKSTKARLEQEKQAITQENKDLREVVYRLNESNKAETDFLSRLLASDEYQRSPLASNDEMHRYNQQFFARRDAFMQSANAHANQLVAQKLDRYDLAAQPSVSKLQEIKDQDERLPEQESRQESKRAPKEEQNDSLTLLEKLVTFKLAPKERVNSVRVFKGKHHFEIIAWDDNKPLAADLLSNLDDYLNKRDRGLFRWISRDRKASAQRVRDYLRTYPEEPTPKNKKELFRFIAKELGKIDPTGKNGKQSFLHALYESALNRSFEAQKSNVIEQIHTVFEQNDELHKKQQTFEDLAQEKQQILNEQGVLNQEIEVLNQSITVLKNERKDLQKQQAFGELEKRVNERAAQINAEYKKALAADHTLYDKLESAYQAEYGLMDSIQEVYNEAKGGREASESFDWPEFRSAGPSAPKTVAPATIAEQQASRSKEMSLRNGRFSEQTQVIRKRIERVNKRTKESEIQALLKQASNQEGCDKLGIKFEEVQSILDKNPDEKERLIQKKMDRLYKQLQYQALLELEKQYDQELSKVFVKSRAWRLGDTRSERINFLKSNKYKFDDSQLEVACREQQVYLALSAQFDAACQSEQEAIRLWAETEVAREEQEDLEYYLAPKANSEFFFDKDDFRNHLKRSRIARLTSEEQLLNQENLRVNSILKRIRKCFEHVLHAWKSFRDIKQTLKGSQGNKHEMTCRELIDFLRRVHSEASFVLVPFHNKALHGVFDPEDPLDVLVHRLLTFLEEYKGQKHPEYEAVNAQAKYVIAYYGTKKHLEGYNRLFPQASLKKARNRSPKGRKKRTSRITLPKEMKDNNKREKRYYFFLKQINAAIPASTGVRKQQLIEYKNLIERSLGVDVLREASQALSAQKNSVPPLSLDKHDLVVKVQRMLESRVVGMSRIFGSNPTSWRDLVNGLLELSWHGREVKPPVLKLRANLLKVKYDTLVDANSGFSLLKQFENGHRGALERKGFIWDEGFIPTVDGGEGLLGVVIKSDKRRRAMKKWLEKQAKAVLEIEKVIEKRQNTLNDLQERSKKAKIKDQYKVSQYKVSLEIAREELEKARNEKSKLRESINRQINHYADQLLDEYLEEAQVTTLISQTSACALRALKAVRTVQEQWQSKDDLPPLAKLDGRSIHSGDIFDVINEVKAPELDTDSANSRLVTHFVQVAEQSGAPQEGSYLADAIDQFKQKVAEKEREEKKEAPLSPQQAVERLKAEIKAKRIQLSQKRFYKQSLGSQRIEIEELDARWTEKQEKIQKPLQGLGAKKTVRALFEPRYETEGFFSAAITPDNPLPIEDFKKAGRVNQRKFNAYKQQIAASAESLEAESLNLVRESKDEHALKDSLTQSRERYAEAQVAKHTLEGQSHVLEALLGDYMNEFVKFVRPNRVYLLNRGRRFKELVNHINIKEYKELTTQLNKNKLVGNNELFIPNLSRLISDPLLPTSAEPKHPVSSRTESISAEMKAIDRLTAQIEDPKLADKLSRLELELRLVDLEIEGMEASIKKKVELEERHLASQNETWKLLQKDAGISYSNQVIDKANQVYTKYEKIAQEESENLDNYTSVRWDLWTWGKIENLSRGFLARANLYKFDVELVKTCKIELDEDTKSLEQAIEKGQKKVKEMITLIKIIDQNLLTLSKRLELEVPGFSKKVETLLGETIEPESFDINNDIDKLYRRVFLMNRVMKQFEDLDSFRYMLEENQEAFIELSNNVHTSTQAEHSGAWSAPVLRKKLGSPSPVEQRSLTSSPLNSSDSDSPSSSDAEPVEEMDRLLPRVKPVMKRQTLRELRTEERRNAQPQLASKQAPKREPVQTFESLLTTLGNLPEVAFECKADMQETYGQIAALQRELSQIKQLMSERNGDMVQAKIDELNAELKELSQKEQDVQDRLSEKTERVNEVAKQYSNYLSSGGSEHQEAKLLKESKIINAEIEKLEKLKKQLDAEIKVKRLDLQQQLETQSAMPVKHSEDLLKAIRTLLNNSSYKTLLSDEYRIKLEYVRDVLKEEFSVTESLKQSSEQLKLFLHKVETDSVKKTEVLQRAKQALGSRMELSREDEHFVAYKIQQLQIEINDAKNEAFGLDKEGKPIVGGLQDRFNKVSALRAAEEHYKELKVNKQKSEQLSEEDKEKLVRQMKALNKKLPLLKKEVGDDTYEGVKKDFELTRDRLRKTNEPKFNLMMFLTQGNPFAIQYEKFAAELASAKSKGSTETSEFRVLQHKVDYLKQIWEHYNQLRTDQQEAEKALNEAKANLEAASDSEEEKATLEEEVAKKQRAYNEAQRRAYVYLTLHEDHVSNEPSEKNPWVKVQSSTVSLGRKLNVGEPLFLTSIESRKQPKYAPYQVNNLKSLNYVIDQLLAGNFSQIKDYEEQIIEWHFDENALPKEAKPWVAHLKVLIDHYRAQSERLPELELPSKDSVEVGSWFNLGTLQAKALAWLLGLNIQSSKLIIKKDRPLRLRNSLVHFVMSVRAQIGSKKARDAQIINLEKLEHQLGRAKKQLERLEKEYRGENSYSAKFYKQRLHQAFIQSKLGQTRPTTVNLLTTRYKKFVASLSELAKAPSIEREKMLRGLVKNSPLFCAQAELVVTDKQNEAIEESSREVEVILKAFRNVQIEDQAFKWNEKETLAENVTGALQEYLQDERFKKSKNDKASAEAILQVVKSNLPSEHTQGFVVARQPIIEAIAKQLVESGLKPGDWLYDYYLTIIERDVQDLAPALKEQAILRHQAYTLEQELKAVDAKMQHYKTQQNEFEANEKNIQMFKLEQAANLKKRSIGGAVKRDALLKLEGKDTPVEKEFSEQVQKMTAVTTAANHLADKANAPGLRKQISLIVNDSALGSEEKLFYLEQTILTFTQGERFDYLVEPRVGFDRWPSSGVVGPKFPNGGNK